MKKIFGMLLCLSLLSGCMNSTENPPVDDNDTSISDKYDDNGSYNNSNDTDVANWYEDFETMLTDNKIDFTSRSELDASSIGGVDGYRYQLNDGNIDVYRYEDGDELERIMKEKKVKIDGKEYDVEVNGNYVIVKDGVADNILEAFKNMGKQ